MFTTLISKLFGSPVTFICILAGAIVYTFVMILGSITELIEPAYPERLFFEILGWSVTAVVVILGIFALFIRKKQFDYPPNDDYEYYSEKEAERRLVRNNIIRIALSAIIIITAIINQWIYDLPFGSKFYLIAIILCVILEIVVRFVNRTLE